MQCIGLTGFNLEYLPINGFCLRKSSGLMVFQGNSYYLRNRRVRNVRYFLLITLRSATLLIFFAAATRTWIVPPNFFMIIYPRISYPAEAR